MVQLAASRFQLRGNLDYEHGSCSDTTALAFRHQFSATNVEEALAKARAAIQKKVEDFGWRVAFRLYARLTYDRKQVWEISYLDDSFKPGPEHFEIEEKVGDGRRTKERVLQSTVRKVA